MIVKVPSWRQLCTALATTAFLSCATLFPAAADSSHVVQPGETLSGIADAYGVPLDVLAAQNHIANVNLIYAGETIVLPGQAPPAGPPPAGSHTVQPGETLTSIAVSRSMTVAQLLAANPELTDPNKIYVGQKLTVPGESTSTPSPVTASAENVKSLLAMEATRYGLEPAAVEALAWQESGWRQNVVSSAGAIGVMQLMPATASWLATDIVGRPFDVTNNVTDNVEGGVAYLRFLIDKTGSVELGVAAYYQGPGSLQRDGMLPETRRYVDNVMAIRSYLMLYGVPPQS